MFQNWPEPWYTVTFSKSNNLDFSNIPAGIQLLEVNNRNTRTGCGICSKLTIKTPGWLQWRRSGVFINFERIPHLVLVFLLLTLKMSLPFFIMTFNYHYLSLKRFTIYHFSLTQAMFLVLVKHSHAVVFKKYKVSIATTIHSKDGT